jgi:hypothetical protein
LLWAHSLAFLSVRQLSNWSKLWDIDNYSSNLSIIQPLYLLFHPLVAFWLGTRQAKTMRIK